MLQISLYNRCGLYVWQKNYPRVEETLIMSKHKAFAAEVDALVTSSYDGVAVHEKMIKDDIRTRSYLDAIENNPELFKDKIALDIGCGTGILSLYVSPTLLG